MPYPPPPGPPDVGEFQAIGKLPAPQLPDVTGHGGEFLETDGIIPQWEPVTGVLPDQTGHAGQFLTTDGLTASWSAVTGALPDQTGHGGEFLTTDGSAASWSGLPASSTNVYDVTNYGAVPNDPTSDFGQAYYNTIRAAQTQIDTRGLIADLLGSSSTITRIYVPPGVYYTSVPICLPPSVEFFGGGPSVTIIAPGQSGPTINPGQVSSFSGPMVLTVNPYDDPATPGNNFPNYGAPLVGATGQSLQLANHDNFWIDDSWAWAVWPGNTYTLTDFAIELWAHPTSVPTTPGHYGIIGSRGPERVWTKRLNSLVEYQTWDVAYGIYMVSDGVDIKFRAYLTTNPDFNASTAYQPDGTVFVIESSTVSVDTTYHLELDYNGSRFDFYVDGVNQGDVVATGPVIRAPWEGTNIGSQGSHSAYLPLEINTMPGYVDSIRLSKVARHTGVGGFTPPAAKYTWDSDTYALYNFDQGYKTIQPKNPDGTNNGGLYYLPFVVGQVAAPTQRRAGSIDGPLPHFIRRQGTPQVWDSYLHDFSVNGYMGCSGVVLWVTPRPVIERVWVEDTAALGIIAETIADFYARGQQLRVNTAQCIGIQWHGELKDIEARACGIGVYMDGGGSLHNCNNQPYVNSYAAVVVGDGNFQDVLRVEGCSYDTEVFTFPRQIATCAMLGNMGTVTFVKNNWQSVLSDTAPVLYFRNALRGKVVHISDMFIPNVDGTQGVPAPACSMIYWYDGSQPQYKPLLINCNVVDNNATPLPLSNISGWLAQTDGQGTTNLSGLSVSDVPAMNLAGRFPITHGTTSGGPIFFNAEPDSNYVVTITPADYTGSAPAAGSNRVVRVVKRTDGFTAVVEADPGGTCTQFFDWEAIRVDRDAELVIPSPTIPSTHANPFSGDAPNTPFAFGVTLVPANTNVFSAGAVNQESVCSGHAVPAGGTDWWEVSLAQFGYASEYSVASRDTITDSYVVNGKLYGLLNPGAHNFVFYYDGNISQYWLDGGHQNVSAVQAPGQQGATLYIGQRSDTTLPLTSATLRFLKMDHNPTRVFSFDSDIGPGLQAQAVFLGDAWTQGFYASGGANQGWAQQIATNRYGTTYYWMAARVQGKVTDNAQTTFNIGLVDDIWNKWAGLATAPTFAAVCIMAGWVDIGAGKTAAAVWTKLKQIIEGTVAQATWTPPISSTSPTDQRAWAIYGVPTAGTSSLTVNGRNFTVAFNTDIPTTTNDCVTQLLADGPTAALFDIYAQNGFPGPDPRHQTVVIQCKVPGAGGNAYVVSTDGANNSICYGGVGGLPNAALTVNLISGVDNTINVAGVTFLANFDTNANTTVDNVVALINADPTASALVTASRVSSQMLVVANSAGAAGNSIGCRITSSYNYANPNIAMVGPDGLSTSFLSGGANGTDQNGTPVVLLCNVPPINGASAPVLAELASLNASIAGYVHAGVTIVDVQSTVWDPGNHDQLNPAYNNSGYLNDTGHTAVFGLINPLLP